MGEGRGVFRPRTKIFHRGAKADPHTMINTFVRGGEALIPTFIISLYLLALSEKEEKKGGWGRQEMGRPVEESGGGT